MSSPVPTPTLLTPRLMLQPLTLADAEPTQALFAHWEIVRYLTHFVPWPYPDGESLRYIRDDALPAMANGEEWHWTLRLRERPHELIGAICVMDDEDNHRGFWIGAPWQRQGLMTEACAAVNRFWFETLERPCMRVAKAARNEASRRLSLAEGMVLVASREDRFVSGPMQEEIWQITRDQWMALNPSADA